MAPAAPTRTVYLPSDPASSAQFREAGQLPPSPGISVDEAYAQARDLELALADDEEEADYWALVDASVQGLHRTAAGPRFVLAARVRPEQLVPDGPAGSGRVLACGVSWGQVSALFIDEHEALEAVRAAREAVGDPLLLEERVAGLLSEHELLWYAPEELDALLT